jgi:hypothetical protein
VIETVPYLSGPHLDAIFENGLKVILDSIEQETGSAKRAAG